MFDIVAKDEDGNCMYVESDTGPIKNLSYWQLWTVKSPSSNLIATTSTYGAVVREYNGDKYLLSESAADAIPLFNHSVKVVAAVSVMIDEIRYYLLVNDTTTHNVEGIMKESDLSAPSCMLRLIDEQLLIKLTHDEITPIGSWTEQYQNPIVGDPWPMQAYLYYVNIVDKKVINHIRDDSYHLVRFTTIPSIYHHNFAFVFIDSRRLYNVTDEVFNGHHRDILHILNGSTKRYDTSYLQAYQVNQPEYAPYVGRRPTITRLHVALK